MDFFTNVYGNRQTRERIGRAVLADTLPHAFLLCGPKGSGKHTLVLEIAAALNCENKGKSQVLPCHNCRVCRRIAARQFTDLNFLSRAPGKATIGVEEVRRFREDMFLSATESDRKLYVIEEADALTPPAQNALLKVLEDPPTKMNLFLLAESADSLLATVRSRVQTVRTERFSATDIQAYLLEKSESATLLNRRNPEAFAAACLSAHGVIGTALQHADAKWWEENAAEREAILRILRAIGGRGGFSELQAALAALPTAPGKRADFCDILEKIADALRDSLLRKRADRTPSLFYIREEERATDALSAKQLSDAFEAFADARRKAAANGNLSFIVTTLAVKLKQV